MFDGILDVTRSIVDFVYIPQCATCHGTLSSGEFYICTKCWDDFARVVATETVIQSIEEKFIGDEWIGKISSVFLFEQDERVRTAVHLLKYNDAEKIADKFGIFIARKITEDAVLSQSDVIVPVPLHPARKRERGYNQSELIARKISEELGIECEVRFLKRTRQTQTQTLFDYEDRRKNIEGAFSADPRFLHVVKNKAILLVDDVITTGSTIKECARVLKENGAAEVYGVSAAIVL
jgi:ComF family protein